MVVKNHLHSSSGVQEIHVGHNIVIEFECMKKNMNVCYCSTGQLKNLHFKSKGFRRCDSKRTVFL
jgi:hypothetical protein